MYEVSTQSEYIYYWKNTKEGLLSGVRFFLLFSTFLVACTRLYKTLCRSVGWSVGRSHFAFFAFLSILKIEKFISEYLISFKTYLGSLLCHFFLIFCHFLSRRHSTFFVIFNHLVSFWLFFSSFNYVSITCLIFNHLLCHFLSFSVIFCHFSSFIS